MNAGRDACCGSRRRALARRCGGAAGWVVPASLLALMPKCPACLAAYVAVATGIGMSASAAAYVRTSAIVACAAALLYLAAGVVRRRWFAAAT